MDAGSAAIYRFPERLAARSGWKEEFARKYNLLEVMPAKFAWEIRGEHDMIIQTGMRTDIPAFYSEWLVNRIKEGYVLVRNPYNPVQVTKYRLSPEVVEWNGIFRRQERLRKRIGFGLEKNLSGLQTDMG